jgi:hypothetical protein
MDTERLIAELVADARPVPRVWPVGRSTAVTVALSVTVLALAVWVHGIRPELPQLMHDPRFVIAEIASVLTGIAAIYACFRSALPDAPRLMPALPLLPFAVWVAMLGSGCLDEFLRSPDAMDLGTSFECLNTIVLTSIPPALVMVLMLRRVVPFHPSAVAAMGALGVSSLASAALTLYHPLNSAAMVLIWHIGTILLVVAGASLFSRPLLRDWRSEPV